IPADCKAYVKGKIRLAPYVSVTAYGSVGGHNTPFSMDAKFPNQVLNDYNALYATYNNSCAYPSGSQINGAANGNAADAAVVNAYANCMRTNSPTAYGKFSNVVNGQGLASALAAQGINASDSEIRLMKAYQSVISAGSEANLLALIK